MKKIYFILVAVFAVLAVSCEKKEIGTEPKTEKYTRTFTCVFNAPESVDPDTKVSLASDGKVAWEVGDQIMLHGGTDGADRKMVTLTAGDISADGKKATFTVEGLDPYNRSDVGVVSEYYAQYPASAVPSGSMYYECCFNDTNKLLMAACNEGDTFNFFNLCGVISYQVSGDFDSVVFSGNNDETVAYDFYQVRVRDDGSGATCNYYKMGNGWKTNTPSTTISADVVPDGTTVNYIYLPRGVNFTGGFIFKFIKSGAISKTVKVKSSVNVDHGKLLPLGDITSHLKDYVAPTSHDAAHPAIAGATDLGASGTANCYIVDASIGSNAEKVFKFKAVKGNGSVGVGTINDVVVLWETYNNESSVTANTVIAEADFDKQDGDDDYWITFKMPADLHEGNAVIAARDVSSNILWSWHIWVPATTITDLDNGLYSSEIMDRNLGALRVATASTDAYIDVTSIGLVYQWGRKDPFLGPDKVKADSYRGWATYTGLASFSTEAKVMTLDESIKNPTLMATGTSTNGNWLSPYDTELWGDSGDKAIYDPCPPGYRVPKRDKTHSLFADGTLDSAEGGDYNETYYWFTLGDPVTVFPCAGYRSGTDFKTTFRTIIWNAHSDSYQGSKDEPHYAAYNRRVYLDGSTFKYRNDSSQYKNLGGSVRCVAE